ncbi:endospore germination permease [Paenibacillus sp. 2TAB23]|uniref:GerAB/ArcD/ProY family transporter n=1 Tax=Paenibacillus sp. 2TAB23 TaxID=3233004 RepID=UPI003F9DDC08
MNKPTIEVPELVSTIILFEFGSTTLFMIGSKAKQDAWLAMSIAASIGLVLALLYLAINYRDPERDLFELCRFYFGKWVGMVIGLSFVMYFAYEASRLLRDMGELTGLVLLNRTPLIIIMLLSIIVVGNTVRYGTRVLFLTCLALFPIMIISYLFLGSMTIGTKLIEYEQILPILEKGWKPILEVVPGIVAFPFGQLVLFLVFFPLVKERRRLRKPVLLSFIFISIILIAINEMNFLVLGPHLVDKSTIPLLQVIQLMEIVDVFERMDVLFVLILFMGIGIKMAAFFVGAVTGLQKITGIGLKKWVVPLGGAIFAASFISPNYTHHMWLGLEKLPRLFLIFQIAIPLFLYLVMLVRRKPLYKS